MNVQELHPAGDFNSWNPKVLAELQKGNHTTQAGEQLVFENEALKVWSIKLLPDSSLSFHKHTTNYDWTALTGGSAISHYETGRIVSLTYKKGDLLDDNTLKSTLKHTTKGFTVDNFKQAHKLSESRKAIGKIVIQY